MGSLLLRILTPLFFSPHFLSLFDERRLNFSARSIDVDDDDDDDITDAGRDVNIDDVFYGTE